MSARTKLPALVATMIIGMLAGAGAANAASFTVNDQTDAPLAEAGSETCASTDAGGCTLRAAVQAADNAGGSSTIELPAGEYDLTRIGGPGEDEPENGDLDVRGSSVTITGAGAATTIIDPGNLGRAFHVHEGASLTLGHATVRDGEEAEGYGGAFLNEGALTVEHSVLDSNSAGAGGTVFMNSTASATSILYSTVEDSAANEGGVIFTVGGEVTLDGDTINNNKAAEFGGVLDGYEFKPGPVRVSRSTISHNESGTSGGAIYLEAPAGHQGLGELTVSLSTFDEDSSVSEGGAIWGRADGAVTVTGSTLSKDTTAGPGGAICELESDSVSVGSSTFDEDHGGEGGALYAVLSTLSLSASTFSHGHGHYGGALLLLASAPSSIGTSTFTENQATGNGGAVLRAGGALSVSASTFAGNSAGSNGGGIYVSKDDAYALTNDTFEGNHAEQWGGALELVGAAEPPPETGRTLLNDTIVRNSASLGGGIYTPEHATFIRNTIVDENEGGDCLGNAEGADVSANIDGDGSCFSSFVYDDQTGVASSELRPLAANGGPVETDQPELVEGSSVVIGAGEHETCPATDARGVSRGSELCDVGAYQGGPYVGPVVPGVTTGSSEEVTFTNATLLGSVNPRGVPVTSCEIEYGTSTTYEASVPCSTEPGGGTSPVPVAASIAELTPGTTYDYRVAAGNANATEYGANQTFVTPGGVTTTTTTTSASTTTTATSTTTTTSATTTTTSATTTTTSTTSAPAVIVSLPPVSGSAQTASASPCASARVERISWRVRAGSHLRRILIMRDGGVYRVLGAGARRVTVSLIGMPKGTVVVKVIGIGAAGRRHTHSFAFHTCLPPAARRLGGAGRPYL